MFIAIIHNTHDVGKKKLSFHQWMDKEGYFIFSIIQPCEKNKSIISYNINVDSKKPNHGNKVK